MTAPLYSEIRRYASQNRISFAMPGHKGRLFDAEIARLDVTELSNTADLHDESDAVKEANALLAALYKSKRSFILSCGSTTAIHAMICSALKPGDTLLTTADCHMSVINICAVMGICIRIADKDIISGFSVHKGISSVSGYLNRYPDIRAVLITSPDYYGICSGTEHIAAECHAHGKPLLVDEAHGTHFIASDEFPKSASMYADLTCNSAHKTLNALTGAAYLHCGGSIIDPQAVRQCINIFETSSPSYIIAASADAARAELENGGGWGDTAALCRSFIAKAKKLGVKILDNSDITRIVLNFGNFSMTGFEAAKILSDKYAIDTEMADLKNVVCIVTPGNTAEELNTLLAALTELTRHAPLLQNTPPSLPVIKHEGIINPQRAFFAKGRQESLIKSAGKISKATVTAYPPGSPVIIAGERITDRHISIINALRSAGAKITGLNGGMIDVVEE